MNPYSHIVIASKLESLVQPEEPAEYYWGAVAPDMRYLAAMRRAQTHLSAHRIVELGYRYPHLSSFLQGYLVHCLADQINLGRIFFRHLPFSVLKYKLSRRHLAVLLELYHIESQPTSPHLSGTHNEVLSELGLSESVSERFAQSMNQVAMLALQQYPLVMAGLIGLKKDNRIEKYASAAKWFQKSWLLRQVFFLGIRAGKIDEQIGSRVAALNRRWAWRPGPAPSEALGERARAVEREQARRSR